MAVYTFTMPKLAMGMNEGTLMEWSVGDGDHVELGGELATVETEKVAYEVEAPVAGFVKILVEAGETVPIETPLALLADSAEELEGAEPAAANATTGEPDTAEQQAPAPTDSPVEGHAPAQGSNRIIASPLARKMAAKNKLPLGQLDGSGPGGRIIKRDILAAQEAMAANTGRKAPAAGTLPPLPAPNVPAQARIPLAGMRAAIAETMMRQMHETATLFLRAETDITELLAFRRAIAQEQDKDKRISVNAIFIKAIATAAQRCPIMNASILGEEIVIWDQVNVGFAMTLPSGDGYTENLVVPVIRDAGRKGLAEIDAEMKRLVGLGMEGGLSAADMADSTITFTTLAGIAPDGAWGNAILNGTNACIVGIGGAKRQPAEFEGRMELRDISPVIVNYDHRLIDGAPAGRFLSQLHACLQNPAVMLL